jgi:hypothetical protein
MSSIVISGDTSGAITLAAPAVSGTNTATLPAATGTVMVSGNMPNFRAYATGGTSCASGAFTKLLFAGETFDTNNNYASSTFTPTVAGYYQINAKVEFLSTSTTGLFRLSIYKNGSDYCDGTPDAARSYLTTWSPSPAVSGLVYCNGTTDYIEIYGYNSSGSTFSTDTGTVTTYCSGFLTRTA